MRNVESENVVVGSNRERAARHKHVDAVAPELMAVRPDLTSAWGGIEVASDGHPAHFYFYDFCIGSFRRGASRRSTTDV